jgi:hypothetical protein
MFEMGMYLISKVNCVCEKCCCYGGLGMTDWYWFVIYCDFACLWCKNSMDTWRTWDLSSGVLTG